MPNKRLPIVVAAILLTQGSRSDSATTASTIPPEPIVNCPSGQTAFHGKCVEKDECCDDALCPVGSVFEFVKEPKCVPCSDAETQSGAAYCAGAQVEEADRQLTLTYRELIDKFPSEQQRLKVAERVWIAFRDKFCAAYAGFYKGGSVEREVFGKCLATETRRQVERLGDLRNAWSDGKVRPHERDRP